MKVIFGVIIPFYKTLLAIVFTGGNAISKIFSADQPKPHGSFVSTSLYTVHMYGHSRAPLRLRDSGSMFLVTFMLYTYLPR